MQKEKMLYISRLNTYSDKHIGTLKKVRGMCKGFLVHYDVYIEYEKGNVYTVESIETNNVVFENDYSGIIGRVRFYKQITKWIIEHNIKILYLRFDHLDSIMVSTFKKLKANGVKVILELPTYPYAGERDKRHQQLLKEKKYFEYLVKKIAVMNEEQNIRRAPRFIDKIVTFTYEGSVWNVPSICIENGVDCDSIRVQQHYSTSSTIIVGVVANLAIWHAVDRVVEGLKEYYNNTVPERIVEFWIVGNGSETNSIKELVKKYGLEEYVKFLGSKTGSDLEETMSAFDIGVGTLGLHRIGLEWGSTLKAKEYCAAGLPFIYASKEKGLRGDEPFALKFPDDESAIDINKMVDFAVNVRNDEQLKMRMREKAENEYSWEALTQKIINDEAYV